MDHPKAVGDRSTVAVILGLQAAGFTVLIPFGENARYDLAIDEGGRLARVQCKTGRLRRGVILFNACSTYQHHARPTAASRHYQGQIEYFAVYCPQTGGVYVVPIEDAPVTSNATLRVEPARNGQGKRIRPAAMYQIGSVVVGTRRSLPSKRTNENSRPTAKPGATAGA
jgi:hypothetical protein